MRYAADAGRLLGRLGRLADAERVLRWGIAINADNERAAEQCHLALGEVLVRPSKHRLLGYLALFNTQAVAPISDKPQWQEFLERFYMRPQQLATLPLHVPDWVTPEGNLPADEGEVEPDPRLGQVD
jgi:hypothetical protein